MDALAGKRVLITGGAVRIGRALARAFAAKGAGVAVHCHTSRADGEALAQELNMLSDNNVCIQADLADPAQRSDLIPRLLDQGWQPDILINNASVYRRSPLHKLDETRVKLDYEINFFAPFHLMREFARLCKAGAIINMLDQRVESVEPEAGTYGLAKKSLRDATLAAAVEWAPAIRVNAVAPGIVLPPPGVKPECMQPLLANVPMGCESSLSEIAAACLFLAMSETVTGQVLFVDGGMHLVSPIRKEKAEADYSCQPEE